MNRKIIRNKSGVCSSECEGGGRWRVFGGWRVLGVDWVSARAGSLPASSAFATWTRLPTPWRRPGCPRPLRARPARQLPRLRMATADETHPIGCLITPSFRNGGENMAEETTRQVLPTAMGFAAKEAIAALRKHHIATAPLLRR